MDAPMHEPARPRVHGLVSAPARPRGRPRLRLAALLLAALSLLAAVAGGLVRAGVVLPAGALPAAAVSGHAALMMCGFFGTMIGLERAVALGRRWAHAAPALSAAAALAALAGTPLVAAALWIAAAAVFAAVSRAIVRRQRAAHTVLLQVAALAWLAGNLGLLLGAPAAAVLALWFGFLVVTIAAERLEMTRLMRRRPGAQPLLVTAIAALLGGALASALDAARGGLLFGAALLALALWLACFDIARRTLRAPGLPRYMAVCLLAGYAWLAVGGAAWAAMAQGAPARDAAFHALGLGFVMSMVMAHAPVILPALARVKVEFGGAFYLPLALLHGSLALRLAQPWAGEAWRLGALLNAGALLLFALTMAGAALRWRARRR